MNKHQSLVIMEIMNIHSYMATEKTQSWEDNMMPL